MVQDDTLGLRSALELALENGARVIPFGLVGGGCCWFVFVELDARPINKCIAWCCSTAVSLLLLVLVVVVVVCFCEA